MKQGMERSGTRKPRAEPACQDGIAVDVSAAARGRDVSTGASSIGYDALVKQRCVTDG
jgi:hypothetical protein